MNTPADAASDDRAWWWEQSPEIRDQLDHITTYLHTMLDYATAPPTAKGQGPARKELRIRNDYTAPHLAEHIGVRGDTIHAWEKTGTRVGSPTKQKAEYLYRNLAADLYTDLYVDLLSTLYRIDKKIDLDANVPIVTGKFRTWIRTEAEHHPYLNSLPYDLPPGIANDTTLFAWPAR